MFWLREKLIQILAVLGLSYCIYQVSYANLAVLSKDVIAYIAGLFIILQCYMVVKHVIADYLGKKSYFIYLLYFATMVPIDVLCWIFIVQFHL